MVSEAVRPLQAGWWCRQVVPQWCLKPQGLVGRHRLFHLQSALSFAERFSWSPLSNFAPGTKFHGLSYKVSPAVTGTVLR